VGASAGTSSYPPFAQESSHQDAKMAVPKPRVSVEPDMAAAEAAPVRPSSPAEAIVVSSKVEAEAAPRAVTPTVSDLLCDIPDTPDVAPSSGAGRVKEASSSVPPGRIVGRVLLDDETIIEPPVIGASGDLVLSRPDPSMWGGPTWHGRLPRVTHTSS
jgi:hypothetical protein